MGRAAGSYPQTDTVVTLSLAGRAWTTKHTWAAVGGLAVAGLVIFAWNAVHLPQRGPGATNDLTPYLGVDYDFHLAAARRWLQGGSLYAEFQLAGPYSIYGQGGFLYPPPVLYLLVPFSVVPPILWWAIPLLLTLAALIRMQASSVAWMAIATLALLPQVQEPVYYGNPVLWMLAAEAWGFRLGWPAVGVLLKPTLAPFALAGVWRRSWWVGLAAAAVLAVPFGSLWSDWIVAISNSDGSAAYSLRQVPLMLIPVVAWLGRRTEDRGRAGQLSANVRSITGEG